MEEQDVEGKPVRIALGLWVSAGLVGGKCPEPYMPCFPLRVLLPALRFTVCSRAGEVLSVWSGGFPLLWGTDATAAEYWTRWSTWSRSPFPSWPPSLLAQFVVLWGGSCGLPSGRPRGGLAPKASSEAKAVARRLTSALHVDSIREHPRPHLGFLSSSRGFRTSSQGRSVGCLFFTKTQLTPGLFNMLEWELTLSLRQVVCNLLVEVKIFHQRCHQKLLSYANFCGNMKTDVE